MGKLGFRKRVPLQPRIDRAQGFDINAEADRSPDFRRTAQRSKAGQVIGVREVENRAGVQRRLALGPVAENKLCRVALRGRG